MAIFLIWRLQKEKKSGYPLKDERTSKIQGKAALGTYYITLCYMVSVLLFNIFGVEIFGLPELEAGWAVISVMLVSGFSFGLLSWYYAKRGEL